LNRIDQKFQDLRNQQQKAFVAYLTAGYPDIPTTVELALAFERVGVDILELGVPFSDPLADGSTIQLASAKALEQGVDLPQIFSIAADIRSQSTIPICLMSYYNPLHHYGLNKIVNDAANAGVDGFIVPDLPPEEAVSFIALARKRGLSTVFFIAPTTRPSRMETIAAASTGFIYYVAITGVTGARSVIPASYREHIRQAKALTDTPICVGFGISTSGQVRAISQSADGVIVGSAIINKINECVDHPDCVRMVANYVEELTRPLRHR
jgi:tryptophan synthase alpha chain